MAVGHAQEIDFRDRDMYDHLGSYFVRTAMQACFSMLFHDYNTRISLSQEDRRRDLEQFAPWYD